MKKDYVKDNHFWDKKKKKKKIVTGTLRNLCDFSDLSVSR